MFVNVRSSLHSVSPCLCLSVDFSLSLSLSVDKISWDLNYPCELSKLECIVKRDITTENPVRSTASKPSDRILFFLITQIESLHRHRIKIPRSEIYPFNADTFHFMFSC